MSGTGSASILGATAGLAGGRISALLICSFALTALGISVAPGASGAACDALVVEPVRGQASVSLLVLPPTALSGSALERSDVTLSQDTGPVTVDSVQRLPASQVELAVALDTAASASDPAYFRARRLAESIVSGLASGVRVAVVSAGGGPEVLSALSADRDQALAAIRGARQAGGHSAREAVALASGLLTAGESRSAQVLLISTRRDEAATPNVAELLATLDERGQAFTAVGAGGPVARSWGDQCPASVGSGEVAGAASLLTERLTGQYEVVAAGADPSAPMTLRIRRGAVDVRAEIPAAAPETAVRGVRIERPEGPDSGRDSRVWLVAGLCVLAAAAAALILLRLAPDKVRATMLSATSSRSRGRRRSRRAKWPLRLQAPRGPAGLGPPEPRPRPERPAPVEGPEPSSPPAGGRPDLAAYRSLSTRQLIKVARRPDQFRGDRIIVYGEIVERGPDFFLARTGAERRWPTGHVDSGPGESRLRRGPSRLLVERRSVRRWRILANYGVGAGLAWQQGLWRDELRPASEQLVGLIEGDVFKAFVEVAGGEVPQDRSGGLPAVPIFVIDRIIVYASSATRALVIDLTASGLSPSRPADGGGFPEVGQSEPLP